MDVPQAVLLACDGDSDHEYALREDEILIGRGSACEIELADERASREHAFVSWDAGVAGYVVEDLQSSNGTKVNGKRIRSVTLAHGDVIEIGRTQLRFALRSR